MKKNKIKRDVIYENPGVISSEIAKELYLAPSTISRFVDKLVLKDLCEKERKGKVTHLYIKPKGKELQKDILDAWRRLYKRYQAERRTSFYNFIK